MVSASDEGADGIVLAVSSDEAAQAGIVQVLAKAKARLVSATRDEPTLEDVFLELMS